MNSNPIRLSFLFALFIVTTSCDGWLKKNWNSWKQINPATKIEVNVNGFGTEFTIVYLDSAKRDLKPAIDSLIQEMAKVADANFPDSEISSFNAKDTLASPSKELISWMKKAQNWYSESAGALEFTEKPLREIWSFSSSGPRLKDSTDVNFFFRRTGFQKINLSDSLILKPTGISIEFKKISEGVILDRIAEVLAAKGIENFHLKTSRNEKASGVNDRGELWKARLSYLADSMDNTALGLVALENKSISTMGNEKEFYIRDSLKIGFTLDPITGYPVNHGLLKATVISTDSERSDAFVDYLMVQGRASALKLDSLRDDVQLILIYHERGGNLRQYISPELKPYLSFPVN